MVGSHLCWLSIVAWPMILKRKTSIYHPSSFCGSGIQKLFIWVVLALLSLMRLQLRCWLRLQSPEGLTGNEEGFTTKRAHSHHWQVSAGDWQEALISHHMSLLTGLLECPHVMAIGFSQIEGFKTRQVESCDLFCDSLVSHILSCSPHPIDYKISPMWCVRKWNKDMNTRRWGSIGAILETVDHTAIPFFLNLSGALLLSLLWICSALCCTHPRKIKSS